MSFQKFLFLKHRDGMWHKAPSQLRDKIPTRICSQLYMRHGDIHQIDETLLHNRIAVREFYRVESPDIAEHLDALKNRAENCFASLWLLSKIVRD